MDELLKYSRLESDRFKLNVFRSSVERIDISFLKKEIIKSNADLVILRTPSTEKNNHHKLYNMGFPVLHVDSLVYYVLNLNKHKVAELRNELYLEKVDNQEQRSTVERMIPIIFEGYKNHYYSNPILDSDRINEGYIEWANNYANSDNKISWIVKKGNESIGFATCSFDLEKKECEGVLYGVLPSYSGRGVYSDIIRLTQSHFKDLGYQFMKVSTQIQNYAVQKVWIREGFFLKNSVETYHINSMLAFSSEETRQFTIRISEDDIKNFGDFSGDRNKLHFDDDFAKELGFSSRIAHGMITQSYISKFFGQDYPGEATIFLNNENVFYGPIYPNQKYNCILSTISTSKSGLLHIVAKVMDAKGKLVLLSYNKLLNNRFKN